MNNIILNALTAAQKWGQVPYNASIPQQILTASKYLEKLL